MPSIERDAADGGAFSSLPLAAARLLTSIALAALTACGTHTEAEPQPDAGDSDEAESGKGGKGGSGGSGGKSGSGGSKAGSGGGTAGAPPAGTGDGKFSFFVTSVGAMKELSKNEMGFGGDLRFGKATGLEGADEICRQIAEKSLPGSGAKGWRAFLSTTTGGPDGGPVHAKDRIGDGPWYDRLGRVVAMTKDDLLQERPRGADPAIINDLPNENGVPNHTDGVPGCTGNACPDNHQVLTGTGAMGMLRNTDPLSTCNDWTSSEPVGKPWCGHSWPRFGSGVNWMSAAADGGCAPCVSLIEMGGPRAKCVGSAGGYGGFYCLANEP